MFLDNHITYFDEFWKDTDYLKKLRDYYLENQPDIKDDAVASLSNILDEFHAENAAKELR
jgi:hypothetical protein